jgi:hypothetical protein
MSDALQYQGTGMPFSIRVLFKDGTELDVLITRVRGSFSQFPHIQILFQLFSAFLSISK